MTQNTSQLALRQLQREVLGADDAKIQRLVAAVDAAVERGEADTVIAPLRPRLAVLRPPRPLRLSRLLFLPLDPLVVPPLRWRPGGIGVPRTALPSLTGVVVTHLGADADAFIARLAARTTAEIDQVAALGEHIWPLAADCLRNSHAPADWSEASGLHTGEYAPMARTVANLLAHGSTLFRLSAAHGDPDEHTLAVHLLEDAAASGAHQMATMLALLLARLPHASNLLQLADDLALRGGDGSRLAPDRALEFLVLGVAVTANSSAGRRCATVDELHNAAVLLESLTAPSHQRPTRMARLETMRRGLDEACRERFAAESGALQAIGTTGLLAKASNDGTANNAAVAGDAAISDLETVARHVRRVEAIGRRLGGGGFYERGLRQSTEHLIASPALGPVDRLRLAEILLGPDAALALVGMP